MATAKKTTTRSRARAVVVEEGPRYAALADSVIDNAYIRAGQEVVYFGLPGSQLRPVNTEARVRKEAVRAVRVDNKLSAEEKAAKLKLLSDEWNGVESEDAFAEGEEGLDTDLRNPNVRNKDPLPDADRIELEKHAQAAVDATKARDEDDTNRVTIKVDGKNEPDASSLQGATPVTDKAGAKK